MYVIGYEELTTTAINIANLTLETLEALTVLAIVYLTLVWSLSRGDPRAREPTGGTGGEIVAPRLGRARRPVHPRGGLPGDAPVSAVSVVGATLIGMTLGTLLTINFLLSRAVFAGTSRSSAACRSS